MVVVYKYLSKNGILFSMFKMNMGIEVGGVGVGVDRKFWCELMVKLNEFFWEFCIFCEVDLVGVIFLFCNYFFLFILLRLSFM